jgi:hypothetical protein
VDRNCPIAIFVYFDDGDPTVILVIFLMVTLCSTVSGQEATDVKIGSKDKQTDIFNVYLTVRMAISTVAKSDITAWSSWYSARQRFVTS